MNKKEEIAKLLISTGMSFEQIASKCECSITEVSKVDAEIASYLKQSK